MMMDVRILVMEFRVIVINIIRGLFMYMWEILREIRVGWLDIRGLFLISFIIVIIIIIVYRLLGCYYKIFKT